MELTLIRAGLVAGLLLLTGCDTKNAPPEEKTTSVVLEGKTMGTYWRASLAGVDSARAETLRHKIQSQLDGDDQLMSTWKPDSALSRFNQSRSTAPWPVDEALSDIVTEALRVGAKTYGAMDITVGPLVNLWGFGPDKQPVKTPDASQIARAKAQTGLKHLTVINKAGQQWLQKDIPGLYVDLSTVGEGYAADHLARLMEREGVSRYLVSVGGAVVTRGTNGEGNPWRVAIQKPTDQENAVQAVVDLNGHGISTSGSYRNYYELDGKRISHVIDPVSGAPIQHKLVSVTVIAPSALEADAWDTGLMVLGTEKAQQVAREQQLAVYMITRQEQGFAVWMSPQFKTFLLSGQN
ncbi:FAD:protein FMN transferase ApbE [Shimwellia blattae]|uniref:FAD:protein FMN transferase n=1 Tax=Shimwellia blattae (strain ATCC 29907 / DSM 4481 / JCM 1650 / NBRC 105725 / CDC 9005-74) TaxID=630626 RepID=I2B7B0_SHIBC|nr:FAD:protein FMN transferase ApbE [Shimwellia blattae]AFJ46414.1 thiamine biosynthesis lipoprotein ApbE precursor [Shimwellia blattae DSM 4481 = NBRC 105725]GAB79995.1 thiamine biosynthesis lipoprotein ApbE [Shimwellia blattae DSM 4481 = NBRC 105725]VDY63881.1 Thiamine biosynthesis lipoprotein ApbE precursor [Shimwellia blattae]VEC22018.1 Thiamine biosynthesis lipoprotein ApbE precursor [Shimwellia blattae]